MSKKRRLRIAIFHLAFVYSGGGEKLVLEEAKGLEALGHGVTIFTPVINRKKCFPDLIGKFSIKTFLPQFPSIVSGSESFQVLLCCVLAPIYAFKFRNFDVILAANQPSPWIAWVVKKLFGVPYISYLAQPTRFLYPRDIDKKTGLFFTKQASKSLSAKLMRLFKSFVSWADTRSIQGSDIVLANGEYMKRVLGKSYALKAVSCPAGANFREKPIVSRKKLKGGIKVGRRVVKKPYILITNRHFAQKRFEHGIVAFSSVANKYPEYSLVITGKHTEYTKEIRMLINRLGLDGKVVLVGYVPDKKLIELYSHASVYLYTAPEEDFGMGVIEAMGQGVPVLVWKNAGPLYTAVEGKTGYLAEPFDVGSFTHKLDVLLSDGKKRKEMAENACLHVKENFSWDNHIATLEKTLMTSSPLRKVGFPLKEDDISVFNSSPD